ncbi:hypothetical protein V8E54_012680 [Elaphomyces granulatus]
MAELRFAGEGNPVFPIYFNPNIFFQSSPSDPTPAIPEQNVGIYILASVRNSSTFLTSGATVKFWVCNPATVPTPANSTLLGTSNVILNPEETMTVLCVTEWVPQWVNNGHECIICEVSAINDPAPPHPSTPWNINDRHVAQHNVSLIANPLPQEGRPHFPILTPIAGVGLFHEPEVNVIIRPAPEGLFNPTLEKFDLQKYDNVTKNSAFGLIEDYVPGAPVPEEEALGDHLTLKNLEPNHQHAFHAFVQLPGGVKSSSAAAFLVEQRNSAGKIVGGVAVFVFASKLPKPKSKPAITQAIQASIPYRPYATDPVSGFMYPDGIFSTVFGSQNINIETHNDGGQTLQGPSMYIEGIGDPNITVPLTISTPTNGQVLASASWKSIYIADFTNATPGETIVSFIVQQPSGSSTQSIRIVKKIFVLGIDYDPSSKNFTMTIPQGTLTVHIKTVVGPSKNPCPCAPGGGFKKHCCCNDGPGGTGSTSSSTTAPYPVLIENGTATWTPSPSYSGTHGPLPFNDPWWKVLLMLLAAALSAIASKVAASSGGSGSVGPEGTADETDPSVHCCTGLAANAETDNTVAGMLYGIAAACGVAAALSDEADLFYRGQTATPPPAGLLTVGEAVSFSIGMPPSIQFGKPFGGSIEWDYTRVLSDDSTLTHSATDPYANVHVLKAYDVYIDGVDNGPGGHYTHARRKPLVVGAQFTRPDGSLYVGAQLYAFVLLWSDTGVKTSIELRDDGHKLDGSAGPASVGNYVAGMSFVEQPTGNCYVFVFAQDVNTTLDGTNPVTAAQTIGGMVLTGQLVINFNDKPCQLEYDAETYPCEPELPTADGNELYKGLEYRFLKPYVDTNTQDEHDIDQYLDSSRIKHTPKAKEDQTQWILDWRKVNESEYHCMAQAA